MAQAYVAIEIRIGAFAEDLGAYPVEAELGDGGFYGGGRLTLDRAALRRLWLEPETYGRDLSDALLTGPIRQAYDIAAAHADADAGRLLRVRLRIDHDAAELHALPWERLRHRFRGGDVPLTTSADTPFSRYVGLQAANVPPLAERPVRLLIAVANPSDLPPSLSPLDAAAEVEGLTAALGNARLRGDLAVTVLPGHAGLPAGLRERLVREGFRIADGPCSLDALRRLLLDHHALHLISHGSYRRGAESDAGAALLHLEGEDGTWQAVEDERFVPALAAAGVLPHLIFLVACESAKRDEAAPHPFVGLGPKLVEAGVPAVVAMQDTVSVRGARQLAGDFWRDLLEHGEVDRAMNAARLLLVDDEGGDWSTPVLFMRLTDGQVFVPAEASPAAAAATGSAPAPMSAVPAEGGGIRSNWSNMPGIAKSALGVAALLIPLLTALVQTGALSFGRDAVPPTATAPPAQTAAPATLAATLSSVHFGAPNVSMSDVYRDNPHLDPEADGFTRAELDHLGQIVDYRIDFRGYQGRDCFVNWTLLDAATGRPVPNGAWITNRAAAWPDGIWTLEAARDVVQGEIWVPHVAPGEYDVEVEVYDDRGILLDSERVTGAAGQPASFVVR